MPLEKLSRGDGAEAQLVTCLPGIHRPWPAFPAPQRLGETVHI